MTLAEEYAASLRQTQIKKQSSNMHYPPMEMIETSPTLWQRLKWQDQSAQRRVRPALKIAL